MSKIARGQSTYEYQICPTNPIIIERRVNKAGARWYWWMRRDTPNEAKASLLRLTQRQHERDADAGATS